MKKLLILLGALALTFTLATAENKCGGDMKCQAGKCGGADKKEMKCQAGKCGGVDKKEMKCQAGKCGGGDKMPKKMPEKGKCGQGKCGS